jgi:hypothetical protein
MSYTLPDSQVFLLTTKLISSTLIFFNAIIESQTIFSSSNESLGESGAESQVELNDSGFVRAMNV